MRVFTDGSCTNNGRAGARGGFAAWFPENPSWSGAALLKSSEQQTNQRAEMAAIHLAINTLIDRGCQSEDIVIYSDSDYCIKCLTVWIRGWMSKGWKTAAGKDVLHQDLIKDISGKLASFKSHRFVHVPAHTGGEDDLSRNNDVVDRMANGIVTGTTVDVLAPTPATDTIVGDCPLRLMGPPVRQPEIIAWVRRNIDTLDTDIINKHLFKAFTEICKARDVTLTKSVVQKVAVVRAERGHLQIEHDSIDNKE